MFSKILLLGSVLAFRPEGLHDGECPYLPGELKSNVTDLDISKLKGVWINLWDEKDNNREFTCMGTKFEEMTEDGKTAKMLRILTSNGITTSHRDELIDDEHHQVVQDYFIHEGRQVTFNNETEASVAAIEYEKVHEMNHTHHVITDTFDPYVFDS